MSDLIEELAYDAWRRARAAAGSGAGATAGEVGAEQQGRGQPSGGGAGLSRPYTRNWTAPDPVADRDGGEAA